MEQPPGEQRRANARVKPTDESRRADAQSHMDGRQARLQAYLESMEAELATHPPDEVRERLERQLVQTRKDVENASRRRVPRAKPDASGAPPAPAAPAGTAGSAPA